MADEPLISQNDIDSLLASLSDGTFEDSANAEKKDLGTWLNKFLATSHSQLGSGLSLQVTNVDPIETWAEWTYNEDPATLMVQQYGSEALHQTLLLLPTADLQRVAVHGLQELVDDALMLPVTEPQMTGLGNTLKGVVSILNTLLEQEYTAISERLTGFEITDYSREFLVDIGPWLTDSPFYEIAWTLTGLPTPVTIYQLWNVAEADRLLTLAYQLATKPESKQHASKPPELATAGTVSSVQSSATATMTDAVTVQPVQFASFDQHASLSGEAHKNLDLVLDISLNLSVELGKTQISIKEVLELTRGSVIELDRIAGEPVDLYANGKLIAKGEVVVIEDNFGLRITSIVSPAERLKGLS